MHTPVAHWAPRAPTTCPTVKAWVRWLRTLPGRCGVAHLFVGEFTALLGLSKGLLPGRCGPCNARKKELCCLRHETVWWGVLWSVCTNPLVELVESVCATSQASAHACFGTSSRAEGTELAGGRRARRRLHRHNRPAPDTNAGCRLSFYTPVLKTQGQSSSLSLETCLGRRRPRPRRGPGGGRGGRERRALGRARAQRLLWRPASQLRRVRRGSAGRGRRRAHQALSRWPAAALQPG